MPAPAPVSAVSLWRSPLLRFLSLLAGLAVLLAVYYYFTGDDATLPVQTVAQLDAVPTVVTAVPVGLAQLPVRVNGYLVSQTHDLLGPYLRPEVAYALLGLLALALVGFLAAVSALPRPAFITGMVGLIFLLMSLNIDLLGIFDERRQYFLILALLVLGLPAFAFHAFWPDVPLGRRLLLFAVLVPALGFLLVGRSALPPAETALQLTSFALLGGAVLVGLLVLWVCFENVYGLLWFNTQADNPASRFGMLPFVATSLLYVGTLGLYLWNDSELLLAPGLHLDPLALLLPAVVVGGLALRRRVAAFGLEEDGQQAAAVLFLVFVMLGSGFVGYAFATANDPLLLAARHFAAVALLSGGLTFLAYTLINFGPLIKQRKQVYRVAYQPRILPFSLVYVIVAGSIAALEFRNGYDTIDQVLAGHYNELGDLTRLQSEADPTNDGLATLAERYYAESGDVLDRYNHKACLGRAALYRFRLQRQNEINILRRALSRRPSEKISLRLAALYNAPSDFFDRLDALREGLRKAPNSVRLNNDLAQLYTRSTLTDSVARYLGRAINAAPADPTVRANQLAFLLKNEQLGEARKLVSEHNSLTDAAWQSNALLLGWLNRDAPGALPEMPLPDSATTLTATEFARFYHTALRRAQAGDTTYAPLLARLARRPENGGYSDQLTFLQAFTQYYNGRPVAAWNTLLPLAVGNSPSAAYYQNLGALWQLEQRLFGAAATQFAQAARNGYSEARLNRAYALALNNQIDSARANVSGVLQTADTALLRPAMQLRQVLAVDFDQDYRAFQSASDTLKAQFLVLRGQQAVQDHINYNWYGLFIERLRSPAAYNAALLAQARRVAAIQAPEAVGILKIQPLRKPTAALVSERNVVYGQTLLGCAALSRTYLPKLARLLDSATFQPTDQPQRLYLRAALADYRQRPQEAARLYAQLLREAPYIEAGALHAASFHTRQRNFLAAYAALQASLEYNPESVELLKAYALAAVPAGLMEYAAGALERLRALLSPTEYSIFQNLYSSRQAAQSSADTWN